MRMYVGQARGAKLIRQLWELGIGECTARGELSPRRRPWFYDNGAWKDFAAAMLAAYGENWQDLLAADPKRYPPVRGEFDREQFIADMDAIWCCIDRPEFIVLPDIVAGGPDSLEFSRGWVHRCRGLAPLYLAVQDGMVPGDLDERLLAHLAGLFVGGTLKWKIRASPEWIDFAHSYGLRCHIGRVGTSNRTHWALRIGADSIDSSLPLWSKDNLKRFLRCTEPAKQFALLMEAA